MVPPIVPVSSVTVLAFTAFLVETERNLKTAFWLSLTLAGSYSFCSAWAATPEAIKIIAANIPRD
jgi:hypothetical protein